ncbi:phage tail protein I [Thiomicrorhabdus cannonii]|uniref:phage tail protein I n=1 Tax=Thiomicrorhabdus cannonii TaxID=2748011 RepID=UPI0015BCD44E|nr:phage tail protein I [Thiomicrorhabdus cannonii]
MSDKPTLLPPNATAQEQAIEQATARIEDVPVGIRDLWNPDTCPASLLPWLAWALSLDTWDKNWTDEVKRKVCASAVSVHRKKGTIAALKRALTSLNHDVAVVEWHQETPPAAPYTFYLEAAVDQIGIPDLSSYNTIITVAKEAKNSRSWMTGIEVHGITRASQYYGAAVFSGETITIMAEPNT